MWLLEMPLVIFFFLILKALIKVFSSCFINSGKEVLGSLEAILYLLLKAYVIS